MEHSQWKRTPVAMAVTSNANLFVVCDDGTVWVSSGGQGWTQQDKAIPGTEAAISAADKSGHQGPFVDKE